MGIESTGIIPGESWWLVTTAEERRQARSPWWFGFGMRVSDEVAKLKTRRKVCLDDGMIPLAWRYRDLTQDRPRKMSPDLLGG